MSEAGYKVQPGALGEHERFAFHCGDGLAGLKSLPDNSVDLVLTDVPYGEVNEQAVKSNAVEGSMRNNFKAGADVLTFDLMEFVDQCARVACGAIYIWCGFEQISPIITRMRSKEHDLTVRLLPWEKCLSGGTSLYARTPSGDGPALLKDLVRVDPSKVQLWNGQRWSQVLAWAPSERGRPLEIEFRSGEKIGCTEKHRWPTHRGLVPANELRVGDIVSSCRLPEPDDVKSPQALPDTDIGWLIGLFLAEGSWGKNGQMLQLSCHADEAVEWHARLSQLAERYHGTCRMHAGSSPKGAQIHIYGQAIVGIVNAYIAGEDCYNKRLRPRAWQRSDTFLRCVMLGYLAGDGGYDAASRRYRLGFTRRNKYLARDLRVIGARIGATVRLRHGIARAFGQEWPTYEGSVRMENSVHENATQNGEVMAIRNSQGKQFWDITVADDPHLFALASGLLTHNTNPSPLAEADIFPSQFEFCVYGRLPGAYHHNKEAGRGAYLFPSGSAKKHPTQKPLALFERQVLTSCPIGGIVCDPCSGYGTAGKAAMKLGRRFIGWELDPYWHAQAHIRISDAADQGDLFFDAGVGDDGEF